MGLIEQFLVLHNGKTEAAKDLRDNLKIRLSRAYEWLDPTNPREPTKEAALYMREAIAKSVIDNRLGGDIHPNTAKAIARDLS